MPNTDDDRQKPDTESAAKPKPDDTTSSDADASDGPDDTIRHFRPAKPPKD